MDINNIIDYAKTFNADNRVILWIENVWYKLENGEMKEVLK